MLNKLTDIIRIIIKKISEWKQTQKKLYNASIVHVIISFEK